VLLGAVALGQVLWRHLKFEEDLKSAHLIQCQVSRQQQQQQQQQQLQQQQQRRIKTYQAHQFFLCLKIFKSFRLFERLDKFQLLKQS
jgi:hypothetical protein